jgi:tRNA-dependent cyclodipeptide synthase
MKISTYLNTTEKEIVDKKFNVLIGISIGNKYFTKENIRDYLLWAVENTKEKVAVLIPDKIHAVNYEVRSGYKKQRAQNRAVREGEKIAMMIQEIINEFPSEKHVLVKILKWEDIENDEHRRMTSILYDEFKNNQRFREDILGIVKEYCNSEKLTDCDYKKLATYPLEELPMLVCGITHDGVEYSFLPYPGISKIDDLKIGLQEGTVYPEISKKLAIKNKLHLIEAYAA